MNHKTATFVLLLFVALTISAQDMLHQRQGCRRGRINPAVAVTRHAPHQLHQGRAANSSENPYIGDRRQLVILAAFSDRSFKGDSIAALEDWNRIFNQEGYCDSLYVGSVHDYFYDQSYGQFRLTFDLHYVTLGEASRYASNSLDDENSQFLVQDIVDSLRLRNVDWSLYDWEGDGFINQLLVVYAGKGMNDGGGSNTIWPHQWWLSLHVDPTTGENCKSEVVTTDGQDYVVDSYCAVQEKGGGNASFGTICHEYSHCFGLPDFYCSGTKYLYGWDLMDYGNYNGDGFIPCGYSAHERWIMGWLNFNELTQPTTVTNMAALSDKGEAYLIRNDGYADEYYIIENRQQKGWDLKLPSSGIIIFRIDYVPELWRGKLLDEDGYIMWVNDYNGDKHCLIFAANNQRYSSTFWSYPYKDNNLLTNTSKPAAELWHANTDSTFFMNKSVTDMAVNEGLASFNFTLGSTAVSEIEFRRPVDSQAVYNLSGQRVERPTHPGIYIINGRKVVK